jgi:hypothetical protein
VPPRPYSDDQLDDLRTRLTTALIAAGQFQRC